MLHPFVLVSIPSLCVHLLEHLKFLKESVYLLFDHYFLLTDHFSLSLLFFLSLMTCPSTKQHYNYNTWYFKGLWCSTIFQIVSSFDQYIYIINVNLFVSETINHILNLTNIIYNNWRWNTKIFLKAKQWKYIGVYTLSKTGRKWSK